MTNSIGHRVIAISRIFLNDQWKFLPWWLLSKSEYNDNFSHEIEVWQNNVNKSDNFSRQIEVGQNNVNKSDNFSRGI